MGDHKKPRYQIPWWYWMIKFDFVAYYMLRGHTKQVAEWFADRERRYICPQTIQKST